jgi:LmbE family N-acetylglucosaminyl deacetylase
VEGGNDRFPRRQVDTEYPGRRLRGADLAAMRVLEAERALRLLGCRVYVRLGLPNHPYNSQNDRLALEEVLRLWGGEKALVAMLAGIIRGFEPRIVVGPDRHSTAYEHFEHEAVGYILHHALATLEKEGGPVPPGVLACVDPRQKSRYTNLIAIPARQNVAGLIRDYRRVQLDALQQHVSQQDAVLGQEFLPRYPAEYYSPLQWQAGWSWQSVFGN